MKGERLPICFFIILWIIPGTLFSQQLINSIPLGAFSKEKLVDSFGVFIQNGVQMEKLIYTTTDWRGRPDTVSGLMVIPDGAGTTHPLVVYQHGTINFQEQTPSNLSEEAQIPIVYGGLGGLALAPDYLGFGESSGFHPFLHAETEASVAIDLLFAARQRIAELERIHNGQLFIAGYSQGGHAAAALHRELERNYTGEFTVTASTPMSGAYDLSGVTKADILDDDEYFFPSFVFNVLLSYDMVYDLYDDLSELFKEPYDSLAAELFAERIELGDLNELVKLQLEVDFGGVFPKKVLQDSVLNALINNPAHPINRALEENDVYDWAPAAPTRLLYCMADDRVTFRNALLADSVMNARGAPDLMSIDVNSELDHFDCIEPSVLNSLLFFAGFFSVPVREPGGPSPFAIHPNPASQELQITGAPAGALLEMLDYSGRLLWRQEIGGPEVSLSLTSFNQGFYLLRLRTKVGAWTEKLVIQR